MTSKWNPIFRLLETMLLISWRTHSFTYKMWFDHEVNAQTHRKRAQKGTAHIFKYYIHIDSEKKNVMMRSSLYIPIAFVISHKWYCLLSPTNIFCYALPISFAPSLSDGRAHFMQLHCYIAFGMVHTSDTRQPANIYLICEFTLYRYVLLLNVFILPYISVDSIQFVCFHFSSASSPICCDP